MSDGDSSTMIRVSRRLYERILEEKAALEKTDGRIVSLGETVERLLKMPTSSEEPAGIEAG